jgi:predicted porin
LITPRENDVKRIGFAGGLCLLAASVPAQALDPDVNLSGTFGLGLSWFQDDSTLAKTTDVDLENNASNFRITAAAQEGGLRAFMAYERGASNDQLGVEDVREFFGGVSGWLGTAVYGRKATDYRQAGERLDPFFNTSVAGFNGQFASEGASYGLSNLTNGYTSNTIAYHSPVFGGFDANVGAYINDNNDQGAGDKADYAIGAGYANSDWLGLDTGVQVLDINGNVVTGSPAGAANAYRVHASIGQNLWAAGLSLEMVDVQVEPSARQYAFASGSYQLLEWLRFAAGYGHVKNSPSYDGNGVTFGAFYDITRNLSAYTAARYVKLDNGNQDKTVTVAGGVKFVFDVDL